MSKATEAAKKAAEATKRRTVTEAAKAEDKAPNTNQPPDDQFKASGDTPVVKQRARLVTDNTDGGEGEEHQPAKGDKMVTVNVPKAFRLTEDSGAVVAYPVGAQKMPESHANHWYAQAHGVTLAK
jgi:hypothetical protein